MILYRRNMIATFLHLHCTKIYQGKSDTLTFRFSYELPSTRATILWQFQESWGDSLVSHHSRNPDLWKNSMVRLYLAMTPPRHQAPVKSGTQLLRQSSLQNFHQPIILPTQFGRRRWPFAEMSLKSLKPFTPPKITWIPKIAAKYLNPEIYVLKKKAIVFVGIQKLDFGNFNKHLESW